MKLKIKRIDKSLPLPEYKTSGAVAFDLYSRVDEKIKPKEIKLLPTNLVFEIPEGYFLLVASRSSTFKKGIMMANNVGIVDQDFCGPEDELRYAAYNFGPKAVQVKAGDRIAQAMLIPFQRVSFNEKKNTKKKSRGGFGTTGK
ncbi:MAG: dUTP diphosphatase [Candidatus Paceibacterota bacterium]